MAVIGAISFFGGVVFLMRVESPGPHSHSIAIGGCLVFAGVVLVPVAWMKRVRRPSAMSAETRAQEADNQPIPPREA